MWKERDKLKEKMGKEQHDIKNILYNKTIVTIHQMISATYEEKRIKEGQRRR